ncbi:N-lysine methyltransferase SMYD2-A-like [Engraulis encrasicolus]|uniref:N-lysine methyltransferase SMYD2-A-like n=1 Tax=Engraulis encrasicolus TaxID=184585 RepID=UPI002FD48F8E
MKSECREGIERFDSPGKGRGIRVTKEFKVGELLFACPAYSYVLSVSERGYLCDHCFTKKDGLAKCAKCKKAFYCNAGCQKADWAMHKLECSSMCAYGENWCPSETVRLVARILAKMRSQKEPQRGPSEKMLLMAELESHVDQMDSERKEMHEMDISALHHFYSKHLDFPDHSKLLSIFSQVTCNGFTVEDEELSHLGSAVYPDVALINHSCSPSVIVAYKGALAEIRAVQNMKPGDEILTSYIDLLYPTEDRNARLRDAYYFTCTCAVCTCPKKDELKLKLRKRTEAPPPEEVARMNRYARNSIREFRQAKHQKEPSELLQMCESSLDHMGALFDDANVYMLHMMYQAMGVCIYQGDWEEAARYGEKIIKPFSALYPAYSMNVASMYIKLGRLYVGLEKPTQGISLFKKAAAIMEITMGKDHASIESLKKEMLQKQ